MADEPAADSDRIDRLERKLDELLAAEHPRAEAHTESHLDRPTTTAEMVRAELERARREEKAEAEQNADKSERQTIREQLAKMMEQKPKAPQPRRQRAMWGPRD